MVRRDKRLGKQLRNQLHPVKITKTFHQCKRKIAQRSSTNLRDDEQIDQTSHPFYIGSSISDYQHKLSNETQYKQGEEPLISTSEGAIGEKEQKGDLGVRYEPECCSACLDEEERHATESLAGGGFSAPRCFSSAFFLNGKSFAQYLLDG